MSSSSIQKFVDLLNRENNTSINADDIIIKEIFILENHPTGKNTGVLISLKRHLGVSGERLITYNRLSTSDTLSILSEPVVEVNETTTNEEAVVELIESKLDSSYTISSDLLVAEPIMLNGTDSTVKLSAKTDSLVWQGNVQIPVRIDLFVKWTIPINLIGRQNIIPSRYLRCGTRLKNYSLAGLAL